MERPSTCNSCSLNERGVGYAPRDGSGRNKVLLLGEALGAKEAERGRPFVGDSGLILNKVLHIAGLKRDDFWIDNTVRCQPPNNWLEGAPWQASAIAHCSQYSNVSLGEAAVVVPMGSIPLKRVLDVEGISNYRGYVEWSPRYKKWVVPTFHPAYILHGGKQNEVITLVHDLLKAVNIAKVGFSRLPISYIEVPSGEQAAAFVTRYEEALAKDLEGVWLACDIETPRSANEEEGEEEDPSYEVQRISFSWGEGEAISMPWCDPYIGIAKRLLSSVGVKIFWNGDTFDIPRLLYNGVVFGGRSLDFMDAWHFMYPDLPRSLRYVAPFFTDLPAWKHLSSAKPEYYSCADADATLRIAKAIHSRLIKEGKWDVLVHHFFDLRPILNIISGVGVGLNIEKRDALGKEFKSLVTAKHQEIQSLIPDGLKPVAKKGGYKNLPKPVRELLKAESELTRDEAFIRLGYFRDGEVWNKRLDFNAGSPQQLLKYVRTTYGEKAVPRHKKTGKPTTDADDLLRLQRKTGDVVLKAALEIGEVSHLKSNFLDTWHPHPSDGRVHGIYVNVPATHRLSSRRPNLQNWPAHSILAERMREMIVAGGDDLLWEIDYSGIEAVEVAYYAKDPDYMRLAQLGPHTFLASHMLGQPISLSMGDSDLRLAMKEMKALAERTLLTGTETSYYDAAKRTVHGTSYLMGALLLHKTYPEVFTSTKVAAMYQDLFYSLFPRVRRWQRSVIDFVGGTEELAPHYYVENVFGYKRWFWDAKRRAFNAGTKRWELVDSADAKKAVATLPQGTAGGTMRLALLSAAAKQLAEERRLMMTIHDSIVGRSPKRELERVLDLARQAMEFPIKEQDGLIIKTAIKVGKNWGPYDPIRNKEGMQKI